MTLRLLPFFDREWVVTPYIGGGLNAWWYEEDKSRGKDTDGWKYGYHGVFGLRVLLDRFDPKQARLVKENYGLMHTYFTLEAVYNWINNLGDSRLDLGGAFYQAGVLFLF